MQHFLVQNGYWAIFMLAILESACIPIPSEVTFAIAGALCSSAFVATFHETQVLNLGVVIALGVTGSVIGSYIAYFVGRTGGRAFVDRWGKYVLLGHADLDRSEAWFEKRGEPAVLIGRCVPVIRTFISLPAGLAEMKRGRFVVLTTIGSGIWVWLLTELGYRAGKNQHFVKYFKEAEIPIVALVVIVIAAGVWHRWHSMKQPPRHAR